MPVTVGTRVRVLAVKPSIPARLSRREAARVMSMVGEEFEVSDIDEYGGVWVTKIWPRSGGRFETHSISLTSEQMLVVSVDNDA